MQEQAESRGRPSKVLDALALMGEGCPKAALGPIGTAAL